MPFDGHIVIGLASMLGCVCMLFFCAAQLLGMLEFLRLAQDAAQPWEMHARVQPTRFSLDALYTSAPATVFAPQHAGLVPSGP
ncbi:MAG: hypothetical protein ACLPG5_10370 [Acidocella sp.]